MSAEQEMPKPRQCLGSVHVRTSPWSCQCGALNRPPVEQGEQPASDLPALREAFRAGFLAVHRAEGPYHMIRVWTFDGVAAADLEPEAWEAYKAQLAGLSRPEGTR
jgi:hypothetical protein